MTVFAVGFGRGANKPDLLEITENENNILAASGNDAAAGLVVLQKELDALIKIVCTKLPVNCDTLGKVQTTPYECGNDKVCVCPTGEGVTGTACPKDGATKCAQNPATAVATKPIQTTAKITTKTTTTKTTTTTPETTTSSAGNDPKFVSSGRCEPGTEITSRAACTNAAAKLGLSLGDAEDDKQDKWAYDPPYCYVEGGKLKYNQAGTNTGSCRSYTDICLCYSGMLTYGHGHHSGGVTLTQLHNITLE